MEVALFLSKATKVLNPQGRFNEFKDDRVKYFVPNKVIQDDI